MTYRFNFERGADKVGAIVHDPQPHPAGTALEIGERQTVILDAEVEFVRF